MPVIDLSKPLDDPDRDRALTTEEQTALDAWIVALAESPPAIPPVLIASGIAQLSAGVITSYDGAGFGSALRISSGKRVRFYFDPPQPDRNYFPSVTTLDPAEVTARVSNWTAQYVEVRTNSSTVEAAGYCVQVTRKQG